MRILFAGGGSGGHLTPIIAIIRELKTEAARRQILDLELFYMGPSDRWTVLLKDEQVVVISVSSGKIRSYFSFKNFWDTFKAFLGILQATWNTFLIMPDVIFSKGGYGAFPAVVSAMIFRIPLIIHESDAVPGKVNFLARGFARRIGISFSGAEQFFPPGKTAFIGIPIRKKILGGNRKDGKIRLDIFSDFPVIGVIGASQGSQKINEAILEVLKELVKDYEVLHQTGETNQKNVAGEASVILNSEEQERYHPFGFLDEEELRDFYSASDLIVARASGTTIYEIAAWAKPSILIPLEIAAQDHQRKNAYEYSATGSAIVIEEPNLTPHILLMEIKKLMSDQERLQMMKTAAQGFARIDSAQVIAIELLKLGLH